MSHSSSWYVSKLGYTIEAHSPTTRNYFLEAEKRIEAGDHSGRNPASHRGNQRTRIRHLAITTDEFDHDYADLTSGGVAILSQPEIRSGYVPNP